MKMLVPMTMTKVDYEYYDWLIAQIFIPPNKTFKTLFDMLHSREFVWLVPNDDNRKEDALELRREFLNGRNKKLNLDRKIPTLLEVIVSLSRRVSFIAGHSSESWAWRLIKNLRLDKMFDPVPEAEIVHINEKLEALIWRTYKKNGRGGFFPLKHPAEDQTQVEIWYQMNAFVIEESS